MAWLGSAKDKRLWDAVMFDKDKSLESGYRGQSEAEAFRISLDVPGHDVYQNYKLLERWHYRFYLRNLRSSEPPGDRELLFHIIRPKCHVFAIFTLCYFDHKATHRYRTARRRVLVT